MRVKRSLLTATRCVRRPSHILRRTDRVLIFGILRGATDIVKESSLPADLVANLAADAPAYLAPLITLSGDPIAAVGMVMLFCRAANLIPYAMCVAPTARRLVEPYASFINEIHAEKGAAESRLLSYDPLVKDIQTGPTENWAAGMRMVDGAHPLHASLRAALSHRRSVDANTHDPASPTSPTAPFSENSASPRGREPSAVPPLSADGRSDTADGAAALERASALISTAPTDRRLRGFKAQTTDVRAVIPSLGERIEICERFLRAVSDGMCTPSNDSARKGAGRKADALPPRDGLRFALATEGAQSSTRNSLLNMSEKTYLAVSAVGWGLLLMHVGVVEGLLKGTSAAWTSFPAWWGGLGKDPDTTIITTVVATVGSVLNFSVCKFTHKRLGSTPEPAELTVLAVAGLGLVMTATLAPSAVAVPFVLVALVVRQMRLLLRLLAAAKEHATVRENKTAVYASVERARAEFYSQLAANDEKVRAEVADLKSVHATVSSARRTKRRGSGGGFEDELRAYGEIGEATRRFNPAARAAAMEAEAAASIFKTAEARAAAGAGVEHAATADISEDPFAASVPRAASQTKRTDPV